MIYKPVFIKWKDAHSKGSTWCSEEDALSYGDIEFEVHHLCYILKEEKEYILVSPRIGIYQDNDEYQFGDVMKIPTSWIDKIIDITKYVYEKKDRKNKRYKSV